MTKVLERPSPGPWAMHTFCLHVVLRPTLTPGSPKDENPGAPAAEPWARKWNQYSCLRWVRKDVNGPALIYTQEMAEQATKSRCSGLR